MKQIKLFSLAIAAVAGAWCVTSTPLRASDSDEWIVTSFRQTYAYRTYLKDDAIRVGVQDGFVTLTGTVVDETHKTLAQAVVANLANVLRVDNRLTVENEANANSDAALIRRVILTLQFHRDVLADRTIIDAKDGVVTLKGVASSLAQKKLTAEYAEDVVGVISVRNEMTVATTLEPAVQTNGSETLDDASITAQIETMLMAHRSTRSVITRVATRNGEVTLTGQTQNRAQNALIVKLVSGVRGVTSVRNEMTVENEPRNE